jgi:hypothetical protein
MSDEQTIIIRAVVCRWVLAEVLGRPDLADTIGTNRSGDPMRSREAYTAGDAGLVAQAWAVAHRGNPEFTTDFEDHVDRLQETLEPGRPVEHWSPAADDWVPEFDIEDWDGWDGYVEEDDDPTHAFLFVLPPELHPHPDLFATPDQLIVVTTCCIADAVDRMSAVTPHWVGVLDTWDEEDQEAIDEYWPDACWLPLEHVARGSVN